MDSCFYAPKTITPDCNCFDCDQWKMIWVCDPIQDFQLKIYNRWGEIVFETKDPNEIWNPIYPKNGQITEDGVYIWQITGKSTYDADMDGVDETMDYLARGHVTVLR